MHLQLEYHICDALARERMLAMNDLELILRLHGRLLGALLRLEEPLLVDALEAGLAQGPFAVVADELAEEERTRDPHAVHRLSHLCKLLTEIERDRSDADVGEAVRVVHARDANVEGAREPQQ